MPRSNNIYYFESNKGRSIDPPLILIHGAGGDFSHWPGQLRRLPGVRVIAPDLPGHGESSGLGHQSVRQYANAVLSLLDSLDIFSAIFCGHSMGGAIAQQIALMEPKRTAGLVLVGTGASLPVNQSLLEYLSVEATFSKAVDLIAKWSVNKIADENIKQKLHDQLAKNRQKVLHRDYCACNAFDVSQEIQNISAPTKIIVGTADKMTIPSYSDLLNAKIPISSLSLIDGSGHMVLWEKPKELTNEIEDFVSELLRG